MRDSLHKACKLVGCAVPRSLLALYWGPSARPAMDNPVCLLPLAPHLRPHARGDRVERARLYRDSSEQFFGVQIATNAIEEGVRAAALAQEAGAAWIDLNCGCPIHGGCTHLAVVFGAGKEWEATGLRLGHVGLPARIHPEQGVTGSFGLPACSCPTPHRAMASRAAASLPASPSV